MYKLSNDDFCIERVSDGALIPKVSDNSEYKKYLEWVEAGNTPAPLLTLEEVQTLDAVAAREKRDSELARADIQLLRVQDGNTKIGTQKAWREYRNALREWPSTGNFPKVIPVAPDAK
jgi:hypothetical protein